MHFTNCLNFLPKPFIPHCILETCMHFIESINRVQICTKWHFDSTHATQNTYVGYNISGITKYHLKIFIGVREVLPPIGVKLNLLKASNIMK